MAERLEDLNLPNTVITRIIKEALSDGVSIAKEARTAFAKSASEGNAQFMLFKIFHKIISH
jgi:DNA polymerase epsilon subunit 3